MKNEKPKRVKLWLCQNNLSGNANGHFKLIELPVNSTKKDVVKANWYAYKAWNIKCLGIFKSAIGNNAFASSGFLKKVRTGTSKSYV